MAILKLKNKTTGEWEEIQAIKGEQGPKGDKGDSGASEWGQIEGTLSNQTDLNNALSGKQSTLVSGTNIKTINNESILGSGNINIQGGSGSSEWGNITGTLSDQADLQTALNSKANTSSIPTKVSQLTNDSGYQNATQVQTAINNAIGTALNGSY